jgi:methylenetetrahydrofolate reductase (NADPH)
LPDSFQAETIAPERHGSVSSFQTWVEVVPPAGPHVRPILAALAAISTLPFDSFSVASNPVARPHMSIHTTSVRDVDVFGLVGMARATGLHTGVVLDPRPESNRLDYEVQRLQHKVKSGAQFVVTQPVYDEEGALALRHATRHITIPILLGILPLRTARHARFLNNRVAGIAVPQHIQDRLENAPAPPAEGVANAHEMLVLARRSFAGAVIMPPFDRYEILRELL